MRRGSETCFEILMGASGSDMCVPQVPIDRERVPVSVTGGPFGRLALVVAPSNTDAVSLRWPELQKPTNIDFPTIRSSGGYSLFVAEPPRGSKGLPQVDLHPARSQRSFYLDGLKYPSTLAIDRDGDLLIADQGTYQIQRRHPNGQLEHVAGSGIAGSDGDGGSATAARIGWVAGMAVAPDGTIYFTDFRNNVSESSLRAIRPDGTIDTLPGVVGAEGIAVAADGAVWTAGLGGVRRVAPDGSVRTVISSEGFLHVPDMDDFSPSPISIAFDGAGNIYVGNFSAPILVEFSPTGEAIKTWQNVRATQLIGTEDGVLFTNYGQLFEQIAAGRRSTFFDLARLRRSGVQIFQTNGLAAGPRGEVYVDHSGIPGNGYSELPVLVRISANGKTETLDTRSTVSR